MLEQILTPGRIFQTRRIGTTDSGFPLGTRLPPNPAGQILAATLTGRLEFFDRGTSLPNTVASHIPTVPRVPNPFNDTIQRQMVNANRERDRTARRVLLPLAGNVEWLEYWPRVTTYIPRVAGADVITGPMGGGPIAYDTVRVYHIGTDGNAITDLVVKNTFATAAQGATGCRGFNPSACWTYGERAHYASRLGGVEVMCFALVTAGGGFYSYLFAKLHGLPNTLGQPMRAFDYFVCACRHVAGKLYDDLVRDGYRN